MGKPVRVNLVMVFWLRKQPPQVQTFALNNHDLLSDNRRIIIVAHMWPATPRCIDSTIRHARRACSSPQIRRNIRAHGNATSRRQGANITKRLAFKSTRPANSAHHAK
jgi:hypothetical protein